MLPPRAYFFLGLNAIRILSIIAMLLVFASSIFVLVNDVKAVNRAMDAPASEMSDCDYIENSSVPNQPAGVFWAVVNRLLIIFQVIVLILSELGWPAAFFAKFFPVLGADFGLGALGIFQCLIGATILSHHVDDFTLVAAFFLFALGCVNMLVGLVFRERAKTKRSISAWRDEAKSVLPTTRPNIGRPGSTLGNLWKSKSEKPSDVESRGMGFGRQGEKAAGLKGFLISKPLESLPRYAPPPARSESSRASTPEPKFKSSPTAF